MNQVIRELNALIVEGFITRKQALKELARIRDMEGGIS